VYCITCVCADISVVVAVALCGGETGVGGSCAGIASDPNKGVGCMGQSKRGNLEALS
jgi:hypothetical protein